MSCPSFNIGDAEEFRTAFGRSPRTPLYSAAITKLPLVQRAARGLPTALAIVIVVLAYAFFATRGTLNFGRFRDTDISFYVQLRQGFSGGHLYMEFPVDPRIPALPNPYDPKARAAIVFYPWDSSYFNGHYYLYYSPLPVLLAYWPLDLITRREVPDQLVAALFCSWAFIAALLFVRDALADARPSRLRFFAYVLFLGIGNALPFVLTNIRSYEVAIVTGMAMTATWSVALLRLLRAPSRGRAAWMGLWLALAFAARPDLLILGVPSAVALVVAFRAQRAQLLRAVAAFAVPLVLVAIALGGYNFARFGDPREYGVRYQLTSVDMAGRNICGVHNLAEAVRLANNVWHYLFLPPTAHGGFPYLDGMAAALDPAVSWPSGKTFGTEQVIGLAPLMPLVMLGTLAALLFALSWRERDEAGVRASILVMAGAWIVLGALSTCWWIVARYSLEFMMLMAAASIVLVERACALLPRSRVPRMLAAVLALYSVAIGFMLGLSGQGGTFKSANPTLIRRLSPSQGG